MRGIIRNHQFKKVELVKITSEKDWETEYNQMLEQAKLVSRRAESFLIGSLSFVQVI